MNSIKLIFTAIFFLALTCACSNDDVIKGEITARKLVYAFTDTPGSVSNSETMAVSSSEQEFSLSVKSLMETGVQIPDKLFLSVSEWDNDKNDWEPVLSGNTTEVNGSFFRVSTESADGKAIIKVSLDANLSSTDRRICIFAESSPVGSYIPYGEITIIQESASGSTKCFEMKAKYKGITYVTSAELDENGNFIFHNEEYEKIMDEIDSNPSSQMVILDDSTIYYYDQNDILSGNIYSDIQSLQQCDNDNSVLSTRADGFENIADEDLGYMALYDNDHFKGKMHYRGLANFHFTYNIPNIKPLDLNDKITSIAVGYQGSDPIVCTVLTVWDDTDYNFGDDDRNKHRISIIASQNSPRVSCPDLKKIKKIGSSKSWNDCISCFSLHFGYID